MKTRNIITCLIGLTAISNYSFSQSSNTAPVVNITSSLDSSGLLVTYNLKTKREVEIYKQTRIAAKCDDWFMDVVIVIEKLDDTSQTYIALSCGADIDPTFDRDGTLGPMIKIKNSKSPDYKLSITKKDVEHGKYRLKIRFYYFIKGQRLSAESKYVYFSFLP